MACHRAGPCGTVSLFEMGNGARPVVAYDAARERETAAMLLVSEAGWAMDGPALIPVPRMQPVAFAGCFGWFHPPADGGDTAVLLCPGLSQDASSGHRSYRQLADRLAAAGYPALRFDYPGTGDSCDMDGEPWVAWQDSIHHALDWLHAHAGARRVVLLGLRIGALLAALVAEHRSDVAGLVLLAPVLRGRSYVNQLAVVARLRPVPSDAAGGIVLGELALSEETQRLMRAADLSAAALAQDCRVVIHAPAETPVLSGCVTAWRGRGIEVACNGFDGLEALLRPTQQADAPAADFSAVLAWMRQAFPWRPARPGAVPPPAYPALAPPGCLETALSFGDDAHLCGIFCRPATGAAPNLAVVMANSGGNPHHGFARFSVELARHLARAGIASLRIDFAGLGDSRTARDHDGPTHVFDVDRTGDMRAAADLLQDLGCRRFAAFGLCSGAYHTLLAGLADPRFATLLMVNLPWFTLRHERPGPASNARRSIDTLAQTGTRTLFLFSEADAGLKQMERHFGSRGAALGTMPGASVVIRTGWDHELTAPGMRRDAVACLLSFLQASTG